MIVNFTLSYFAVLALVLLNLFRYHNITITIRTINKTITIIITTPIIPPTTAPLIEELSSVYYK